jgi:hypothetical protein
MKQSLSFARIIPTQTHDDAFRAMEKNFSQLEVAWNSNTPDWDEAQKIRNLEIKIELLTDLVGELARKIDNHNTN